MIEKKRKYGCLTVLDLGDEYSQSEEYREYKNKYDFLMDELKPFIMRLKQFVEAHPSVTQEKQDAVSCENPHLRANMRALSEPIYIRMNEIDEYKLKLETHYKCQCRCGRIHYYCKKTLESKPRYCIYPVPISTRYSQSTSASKATSRKMEKYKYMECVELRERTECVPSNRYCDLYNQYKSKQMDKKEEERRAKIASMQRQKADGYDTDYSGVIYESLEVLECISDDYEIVPPSFTPTKKQQMYGKITVYKLYRCRCYLCGKEQRITCDKFGIYPPTQYGLTAYNGYWSSVKCDCHHISSFQWIVNKLLVENMIPYRVEISFPDLYGVGERNLLRFDFGVYNEDGSLKCLIECQGEQHYGPVDEYGGTYQYMNQIKNDDLKREYVRKHKIVLIEIPYKKKRIDTIRDILISNGVLESDSVM